MAKIAKKVEHILIPCVEFQQNNRTLYLFNEDAKKMWQILSINRKIENKDEGYQRALSQSRVKAISKYIDSGFIIPQSLLISLDKAMCQCSLR